MWCPTISLSWVAVTFCLGFQLLPARLAEAQGPAEDETAAAIKAARQEVVKEFRVPEDKVRVVGEPLYLPDHVSLHRRAKGQRKLPQGKAKRVRTVLVTLDAGLGDSVCGVPHVLVEVGEGRVFPHGLYSVGKELPFTEEECQRVLLGVEQFMEAALDYKRGPERFLPLLAERVYLEGFHEDSWEKLSSQDRHRLFSIGLNGFFLTTLRDYEEIQDAEDEDEGVKQLEARVALQGEGGALPVEAIAAYWDLSNKKLGHRLEAMGMLGEGHLAAVRPYMKYYQYSPLIGKLQDSDLELRSRFGGAVLYGLMYGEAAFLFVWESGRLRLRGLHIRQ